ncbi:hypothetical protein HU200_044210 [Digitaria exilis]|uniref:GCK domain-containing protein n=1 Tax=Digitaria exilis TaxID=1010633 RepID=A0A835EEF4_9POAL|nr:hypothetical protein HU200_044210 [Digitaria exilis]CAB3493882.1 unnamed protein product [Digitaria exilis]
MGWAFFLRFDSFRPTSVASGTRFAAAGFKLPSSRSRRDFICQPQNPSAMGAAASASPPPPLEAATAAADSPTPTAETSTPQAKEDPQQSATAAAAGAADGAAATAAASADAAETVVLDASAAAGEGEEEQAECGFCLFMKGGGCKEEFIAWEKCVEEAEAATGGVDVVERCQDITAAMRKCMDKHAEYYEPILRAERAMAADLEAFQAQEAAAAASDSANPAAEEGQKKAPPSEEGQEKQAVSEKDISDLAA